MSARIESIISQNSSISTKKVKPIFQLALTAHKSKCTPSSQSPLLMNKVSGKFFATVDNKVVQLAKQRKSPSTRGLGKLKYIDSFGSTWVLNKENNLTQLNTRLNSQNFVIKGKFHPEIKAVKNRKNFIFFLKNKKFLEVFDTRRKKVLYTMKLSEKNPRIQSTELHFDEKTLNLQMNFDNFNQVYCVNLLSRKLKIHRLDSDVKGGKLFCRSTFLSDERSKRIILLKNEFSQNSENSGVLEVKNLGGKRGLIENTVSLDGVTDCLGKLYWLDQASKKKFVILNEDKIFLFELTAIGEIKKLKEESGFLKEDLEVLKSWFCIVSQL